MRVSRVIVKVSCGGRLSATSFKDVIDILCFEHRQRPIGRYADASINYTRMRHGKSSATSYRPGGGETICPPPMAVRLAADLRPSADGSAVRTSLVASQLQAASVPIAQAAAPHSQRAIHRVTVAQFRSISMPAGFHSHFVGKTLRNVCYSNVT